MRYYFNHKKVKLTQRCVVFAVEDMKNETSNKIFTKRS